MALRSQALAVPLSRRTKSYSGDCRIVATRGGGQGIDIELCTAQSRDFIAGVYLQTISATTHPVCIDSSAQLGDCPESSLRFKQEVKSMGAASAPIFDLRPVTFRFKQLQIDELRRELRRATG